MEKILGDHGGVMQCCLALVVLLIDELDSTANESVYKLYKLSHQIEMAVLCCLRSESVGYLAKNK